MTAPALPWVNHNIDDVKRQFAALIYTRPDTPVERMNAARQIYPAQNQVPAALTVATEWPYDPVVIEELERLGKEQEQDLPTAEKIARDVYNIANDPTRSVDDRLKAYKLYAEMRGFTQKGGTTVNNNVNLDTRGAFVLPADQTIEEWEAKTIPQQANLVKHAST